MALLGAVLLCNIALQLLNPQILRGFIDTARAGGSLQSLTIAALIFLGLALAIQLLSVAETYVAENIGWTATNSLRADLTLHCLYLDPDFHAAHTPGAMIERIDGDVAVLGNFFSRFVVYVLGNALGPAAMTTLPRKLRRAGGNGEERLRESMAKAREIATQFPRLRVRLDSAAAAYAAAPAHSFEFGLQAILDGLEARLGARRTPADQHARQPRRDH